MAARTDPRDYQVVALTSLLVLGKLAFGFDVSGWQVGVTLASALAAQGLAVRMGWPAANWASGAPARRAVLPPFEWKSALISGLSLCLLRSEEHTSELQ